MFGTGDVPNQLRVLAVQQDPGAPFQTHIVLQQLYGGLEVLGCQLRVHLSQGLNVTSISGTAMLGTSDPAIDVHWWFDVGSAVRYRVHYYCTGDSCDIR